MLRVLMVLEDYRELMFLQTVLKKIGFDVDAIQNPRQLSDALLTMNPDLLVMTAMGKKVKGVEMSRTVKRSRGVPRIILIRSMAPPHEADPNIDIWLDSPVGALTFLNAIGDACGLDKEVLADKFVKLRLPETNMAEERVLKMNEDPSAQEQMQKGTSSSGNFEPLPPSSLSSEERRERYKSFLAAEVPVQTGFSMAQVQDQVKQLRKSESAQEFSELERERKAFVEQLFKK